MFAYIVKRVLIGILVVLLMSLSIFALFWYGPSSPAQPVCDKDTSNRCTPERLERFEESLGYNNPMIVEYGKFVKGVVVGRTIQVANRDYECPAPCLGISYTNKKLVWDGLTQRLPATLSIALGGAFLYLLFGIPIGIAAARRRGTTADKALVSIFLVISSIPYYLFALLLFLYLTVVYEVPAISDTGYFPITENPAKWFSGLLPRLGGARHVRGDEVHAFLPRRHGRGAQRGLRAHGEGQGPADPHRGLPPRPARRARADRHHLRRRPRHALRRHDLHRADLRDAGHRLLGAAGGLRLVTCRSCWRRSIFAAVLVITANLIVDVALRRPRPPSEDLVTQTQTEATPHAGGAGHPYLVVEDLTVSFPTGDGRLTAVRDLSYSVERGKTLGIVGESGSGKSVSSMAVMGLHDAKSARITGSIKVDGQEVVGLRESQMRKLRGNSMAMIFQDALAALHPFYKVGAQLAEAYESHHPKASKRDCRKRAIEMLDRVGIPQPDRRVDDFPHQFSGGMRQRAMIAMGLINNPALLIADEPTTALDVTVQAQILDLLQDLQREYDSAIIMITHDLGVIAEMADDVLVMYGGRAVEFGTCKTILTHPEMPYTWGLLSSIPDVQGATDVPLVPIPGNPPSLLSPPPGCAFEPRCTHKDKVEGNLCATTLPDLAPGDAGTGHLRRCHLTDPTAVFRDEVLPQIDPEAAEANGPAHD